MMRLGWARVQGDSMSPTLADGDRLLVVYGLAVQAGDLVLLRVPGWPLMVKRATVRTAEGWWVERDGVRGRDSADFGAVPPEGVLAVVLARSWPRPAVRRGLRRHR